MRTIWHGLFYDAEMPDSVQNIMPNLSGNTSGGYIAFQDMTDNLKLGYNRDSQISQKERNNMQNLGEI